MIKVISHRGLVHKYVKYQKHKYKNFAHTRTLYPLDGFMRNLHKLQVFLYML